MTIRWLQKTFSLLGGEHASMSQTYTQPNHICGRPLGHGVQLVHQPPKQQRPSDQLSSTVNNTSLKGNASLRHVPVNVLVEYQRQTLNPWQKVSSLMVNPTEVHNKNFSKRFSQFLFKTFKVSRLGKAWV